MAHFYDFFLNICLHFTDVLLRLVEWCHFCWLLLLPVSPTKYRIEIQKAHSRKINPTLKGEHILLMLSPYQQQTELEDWQYVQWGNEETPFSEEAEIL